MEPGQCQAPFKKMQMSFDPNSKIALLSGAIGGILKYIQLLQVPSPFLLVAVRAVLMAFICGAAGVAGKELYVFVKKKYFLKAKNKNEKTV